MLVSLPGDEQPEELSSALQKSCHVARTGALFDFNKATLNAEATTTTLSPANAGRAAPVSRPGACCDIHMS